MKKLNETPTLYTHELAARMAYLLNAGNDPDNGGDGWRFVTVPFTNGLARIDCLDETGDFVGSWSESA